MTGFAAWIGVGLESLVNYTLQRTAGMVGSFG